MKSKFSMTEWKNPLTVPQRFILRMGPGPKGFEEVVIGPGEIVSLPSEFDRGIQRVENGVVVAGLAPLLERVGAREKPTLDPALDPFQAEARKLEAEAASALLAKQAADQALLLATQAQSKRKAS